MSVGLTKSIWLQFGTDIKLLEAEISFLKKNFLSTNSHKNYRNFQFYGSLLIPSKQFISRFKFRPWKGVYISEKYLNSLDYFYGFTKDLIDFYLDNNIFPVIETEFAPIEKLEKINTFFKI